jgi:hypothetical protein
MAKSWASRPLSALDEQLQSVRDYGSVGMIATPWRSVVRCTPHRARSIGPTMADAALDDFDQIPVVAKGEVVEVLVRDIGIVPAHSGMFMSAEAPLVTFLETADRQPFRILLRGETLVGLVTLSDLQRLPVYPLLFSMTVAVEAMLRECIRRSCRDDEDKWLTLLTSREQSAINVHYERARAENLAIDRLSFAGLAEEIRVAVALQLCSLNDQIHTNLLDLQKLRNQVCHVQGFAETIEHARRLPKRVHRIHELSGWLRQQLSSELK